MATEWLTSVRLHFDVGSVSSHAVLDIFTCLPNILDAAECAFYQVNEIDDGTGDIFPDLEGLLGSVACQALVWIMFLHIFNNSNTFKT